MKDDKMVHWCVFELGLSRLGLFKQPWEGGKRELHFLWKEACCSNSRGGGCSLSSSLFPAADWCWQPLPFSSSVQCKAQLCHWELHQSPVCCWAPRAAQQTLATFTCSHNLNNEKHSRKTERESFVVREVEVFLAGARKWTNVPSLSVAAPGFSPPPGYFYDMQFLSVSKVCVLYIPVKNEDNIQRLSNTIL